MHINMHDSSSLLNAVIYTVVQAHEVVLCCIFLVYAIYFYISYMQYSINT